MEAHDVDAFPIVLIHGLFGSLSDPALMSAFTSQPVLAPDLLGYGKHRLRLPDVLSLTDQADHVLNEMNNNSIQQATLVGHSVGGAVAALIAIRNPERVKALVSIEGNMTPPDAFWSAELAKQPLAAIQQMIDGYQADVAAWITDAGVTASAETVRIATDWLNHQPASTLKAQARAVVEATSKESGFIEQLKSRLLNGLELHLIAGEKSRDEWYVPKDIEEAAKSVSLLPGAGHLMMLESPAGFAGAILDTLK